MLLLDMWKVCHETFVFTFWICHVWWRNLHPPSCWSKVWWLVWKSKSWSMWQHYLGLRLSAEVPSGPACMYFWNVRSKSDCSIGLAVSTGIASIDMMSTHVVSSWCAIDFPKEETEPEFLQSKQRWPVRMRSEWQGASNDYCIYLDICKRDDTDWYSIYYIILHIEYYIFLYH